MDLVFIVDSSGSIRDKNPSNDSYDNYDLLLQFVTDIIDQMTIGPSKTRVGLVIYSNLAKVEFHLNTFSSKAEIKAAVKALRYIGRYIGDLYFWKVGNFLLKLSLTGLH